MFCASFYSLFIQLHRSIYYISTFNRYLTYSPVVWLIRLARSRMNYFVNLRDQYKLIIRSSLIKSKWNIILWTLFSGKTILLGFIFFLMKFLKLFLCKGNLCEVGKGSLFKVSKLAMNFPGTYVHLCTTYQSWNKLPMYLGSSTIPPGIVPTHPSGQLSVRSIPMSLRQVRPHWTFYCWLHNPSFSIYFERNLVTVLLIKYFLIS